MKTKSISLLLHPVVHQFFDLVPRVLGLRNRLRCPECGAVGTWKNHGGWYDRWRYGDRCPRRWLCKFCGFYVGPEGLKRARPNHCGKQTCECGYTHAWTLAADKPTPAELIPSRPWWG